MASSVKQKGIIVKATNKKTGSVSHILIAQKTGYLNVTINGKQFYYNKTATSTNGKAPTLKNVLPSTSSSKKKVIVVRKR